MTKALLPPEATAAITREILLMYAEATLPARDMRNIAEDAVARLRMPSNLVGQFMLELTEEVAQKFPGRTVSALRGEEQQ